MDTERKKVLDMLAGGRISTEDAERLLNKLDGASDGGAHADAHPSGPLKYLRVLIDGKTGDKVNVRVPLGLLRTGIKLSTMVPALAGDKLRESGIDLSHLSTLSGDELIEELRDLKVDVDSTTGDTVRVFCE
jgi:hypothetical protein